jgi:DNA anti-recombination protein RmuC
VRDAIKKEFETYGGVVASLSKQLATASSSVEKLGTRARAVSRKLKDVELSDAGTAERILGLVTDDIVDVSDLVEEGSSEIIVRRPRPRSGTH